MNHEVTSFNGCHFYAPRIVSLDGDDNAFGSPMGNIR